jgi:hypothetical protein
VIVLVGVRDAEGNCHAVDETGRRQVHPLCREIVTCGKYQFVLPGLHRIAFQQRTVTAAVLVGRLKLDQFPLGAIDLEQLDLDACARLALRRVEREY